MRQGCLGLCLVLAMTGGTPALAEDKVGSVTLLPLPRYVSIKAGEANARRGPGLDHRIDWVFVRRSLPVKVTGEFGHWRRVEDSEGEGGWVHYSLLSGIRSVLVTAEEAVLRDDAGAEAIPVARVASGVIARLEDCVPDWCRVKADDITGWAPAGDLWGIGPRDFKE